jgi:hypothetical protein
MNIRWLVTTEWAIPALTDFSRRVSRYDSIRRHVSDNYPPGSDNRSLTDGDARADKGFSKDHGTPAKADWRRRECEIGFVYRMARRTKKTAFTDSGLYAKLNALYVVAVDCWAQTCPFTQHKIPWSPHASRGIDFRTALHSGAKQAQHPSPPPKAGRGAQSEQEEAGHLPGHPCNSIAYGKTIHIRAGIETAPGLPGIRCNLAHT